MNANPGTEPAMIWETMKPSRMAAKPI